MGVFRFLLLIGFFTSTSGVWVGAWCQLMCPRKVDPHCGDSSYANCEYTASNYCMLKHQECARIERNWPKFDYVVRGKCFQRRPQCREFKLINGPKPPPKQRPLPRPSYGD